MRLCTVMRRDGRPCHGWAAWDDPLQRCAVHAGRHFRGKRCKLTPEQRKDRRSMWLRCRRWKIRERAVCRCMAYLWPHRPASGLCRWPDPPNRTYAMPTWEDRHRRRREISPSPWRFGKAPQPCAAMPIEALASAWWMEAPENDRRPSRRRQVDPPQHQDAAPLAPPGRLTDDDFDFDEEDD